MRRSSLEKELPINAIVFAAREAPPISEANQAVMYLDRVSGELLLSTNGSAFATELGSPVWFGDGSDGVVTFDGTTTVLGLVPSANVYTLTRDIYLAGGSSIASGVTVQGSFHIYCSGAFTNNGTRSNAGVVGGAGGNASANTAGAAGTAASTIAAGSCPAPLASVAGVIGGAGSTSTANAGGAGVNGTALTNSIGVVSGVTPSASGAGGASGATSGGAAGAVGTDGTVGALSANLMGARAMPQVFGFLALSPAGVYTAWKGNGCPASSGGAGGGGGDATNLSGAGGGSGAPGGNGGYIADAIYQILGSGVWSVAGGTGGAGGNGGNANATGNSGGGGGGAGGAGGTGGVLVLIYSDKSQWTGSFSVAGGLGGALGTGGTKSGTGTAGSDGLAGPTGKAGILIQVRV